MKKMILLLTSFIAFTISANSEIISKTNFTAKTMAKDNSKEVLEIIGVAKYNGEKIEGLKITIYEDDNVVEEFDFKKKKKLRLYLEKNKYYTVVYHKEGFVPRIIVISTSMPQSNIKELAYEFEFELNMIPIDHDYNEYYIDFPVAIIQYNAHENHFTNSKLYNKHIKELTGEAYYFIQ